MAFTFDFDLSSSIFLFASSTLNYLGSSIFGPWDYEIESDVPGLVYEV